MSIAASDMQLMRAVRSQAEATRRLPVHTHNGLHAHSVRFYFNALDEVRQIATSAAGEMDSGIKPITGL